MNEINDENLQLDKDKPKKKILFGNFFSKLKKIKHLDKVITILFIAIILLIYFSSFSISSNSTDNNGQLENNNQVINSLSNYEKELEEKITKTLSSIKDAGNVSVMVYFTEGIETVIAYKTETQTNTNGVVVETKTPILITKDGKSETIVLQENMPQPASIVVVATGAKNTNVKLEILRAVQAMFSSGSCNIEIFAGN